MQHAFKFLKNFISSPTHAGLRYENFGVVRAHIKPLNAYLKLILIPRLRKDRDNEVLKERFRALWALRELIRKDNERRDYKTRFGT